MYRRTLPFLMAAIAGTGIAAGSFAADAKPTKSNPMAVAAKIDADIQKRLDAEKVKPSPLADDVEFMRRAYLDITGQIPSADKARAFIDSKNPDKRRLLIDELLASPNFGKNYGIMWRNLIYNRNDDNRNLRHGEFTDWLADGFNKGRGWDKTVYAIIMAEGQTNESPQGFFYMANRDMNLVDVGKVVGSINELFLGNQMACAQCHNHPFTKEWKRDDFWGMAAFFARVRDMGPGSSPNKPSQTGGRIYEVSSEGIDRRIKQKKTYVVPKPGAVVDIPNPSEEGKILGTAKAKFFKGAEPKLGKEGPYRQVFAAWAVAPDNKFFANASVNRIWFRLFARGLVDPVTELNDHNAPSHPETMALLAQEFKASGFDYKHMIRCICNTQAYQRTSKPINENKDAKPELFSRMTVKVMNADALYDSLYLAMGQAPSSPPPPKNAPATPTKPDVKPTKAEAKAAAAAKAEGKPVPKPEAKPAAEPQPAKAKTKGKSAAKSKRGGRGDGARENFVKFFALGDDNDPTESGHGIPQFLRLMNSEHFNKGGPIVDNLLKSNPSPDRVLEGLFLATLSRRPTAEEVKDFTALASKKQDPKQGYGSVLWVLLNCAEFINIR